MRTLGRLLWLCITIMMVVLATLFTTSNETLTTVHLWPLESGLTTPLWLALITAFFTGGLIGALLVWGQGLTIRARLWQLQRRFDKLQTQTQKQTTLDSPITLPKDCR